MIRVYSCLKPRIELNCLYWLETLMVCCYDVLLQPSPYHAVKAEVVFGWCHLGKGQSKLRWSWSMFKSCLWCRQLYFSWYSRFQALLHVWIFKAQQIIYNKCLYSCVKVFWISENAFANFIDEHFQNLFLTSLVN